jgi:NAD(P)-dependent dehydrogenase (short-subunit alcohol dehydrogenase family)
MDAAHKTSIDKGMQQAVALLGGLVKGVWLTTLPAVPHLTASGSGRIVNLASDTALWGAPRLLAYVASQGAILVMIKAMGRELADQSISVNAIAPGLTLVEATEYVPQARHEQYANGRAITPAQIH